MTPILNSIRLIWPVPDADEELNPPQIFESYEKSLAAIKLTHDDSFSSVIAELSKELIDQSTDRRNHIEGRANAVVNIAGISLALLGGLAALLGRESSGPSIWFVVVALFVIFVTLTYLLGSILAAMQVYGRIFRATLDPNDLVPSQDQTLAAYSLKIGSKRIAYAIYNYRANNRAVGFVYAAQRRLQYGMALLVLVGSLFVLGEGTKRNDAKVTDIQKVSQPLTRESPSKSTLPKPKTPLPSPSSSPDPASPSNQPK